MSQIPSAPRLLRLPVDLDGSSAKAYQRTGSPSTSPLHFQEGFLKIPEGVRQPAREGSVQCRTSIAPSPVLSDHERHITAREVFPVFSELAEQETRILPIVGVRQHQGAHWLSRVAATLGYPAGAGAVISLYVLVPAMRLSSFMGPSGWEHLAPFGLLGLAECSIIAIMRKTTAVGQRQHWQLDRLGITHHRSAFEGIKPSLAGEAPDSLPAQVPYHLSVRGAGRW
jgi:hypothetical protein